MPQSYPKYSVLMTAYKNDRPDWTKAAINSMLSQTIPPSEFVIVADGPISTELDQTISEFQKQYSDIFSVISLPENLGAGPASKIGIENCHNELVARLDADDYAVPTRVEEQLKVLQKNPELDVIGSTVNEFKGDLKNVVSYTPLPEKYSDIYKFAKKRCPYRHSATLYKKSAVLKAGNYRSYRLFEDYDIYIRMLQTGAICYNIQKPLTYVRVNDDFYRRRGGIKYCKTVLQFKKEQVKTGFFTKKDFIISSLPHICVCLAPNFLRTFVYKKFLRTPSNDNDISSEGELR